MNTLDERPKLIFCHPIDEEVIAPWLLMGQVLITDELVQQGTIMIVNMDEIRKIND